MDTKTLIEQSLQNSTLSAEQARDILNSLAAILGHCGAEQDMVAIPGFGTFESKKRLERINIHPSTGKRMLLPPKIVLGFRPSALLKQKVK